MHHWTHYRNFIAAVAIAIAACGDSSGGDAAVDASSESTGSGGTAGTSSGGGSAGTGGASGSGTSGAGGGMSGSAGQGQDASKPDTGGADAANDAAPCSADGACGQMSCCYQDRCIASGEPCGAGNICFFTPVMGSSCQACGQTGQPCCAGNICVDGSRCVASPQGYRCLN